jgi:DNA helicase-2/ATP-dependent DNA helicase PcrA
MFRIFGPPGTGKTTTLLNMVEQTLDKGVPPSQVGFFAFTRKAATEAKERAAKRFDLDPDKDLPYFRTIHSLAYRLMGVKETELMGSQNYKELSQAIGFALSSSASDDENVSFKATDHPILQLINLSKTKKTTLEHEYNHSNVNFTWVEVKYVADSYANYKSTFGLMDFTDLIMRFANEADHLMPPLKICFLDEAQDLSPLQWDIAHKLDEKSERMYVAGDDDQAIYRWAGADVDHFINLSGDAEVLEQSYRVPAAIHALAEKIASRIQNRFPKIYHPKKEQGQIFRVPDIRTIDMSEGSWLIMAQARYMLREIEQEIKNGGYLFERQNGARSIPEKMSLAINGWETMRKGKAIPFGAVQAIYGYMTGNGARIKRGHKNIAADDEDMFDLKQLQDHYGLLATDEMIWHEAMDRIPDADRAYITALLRSGEKFNAKPRIRLSTIHGTKGGEAENVVILPDLTAAAMEEGGDDLHRVFYVGVTRTLKNLYILEPDDYLRAYAL